jgi:hypothetical protein
MAAVSRGDGRIAAILIGVDADNSDENGSITVVSFRGTDEIAGFRLPPCDGPGNCLRFALYDAANAGEAEAVAIN